MSSQKRIVSLVDMDCFYVQVVQRKDPTIKGKPCAVVQYNTWKGGGIIAVSYEARKFGVTRQMRGDEAKLKCPDIVLVQVPENRGKADLTQFREAGAEVMEVLAMFTEQLERASIDEAYMDLTSVISSTISNYNIKSVALETFKTTHLIGLDNKEVQINEDEKIIETDLFQQWKAQLEANEETYRLAIGAVIARKMREAVFNQLGFTCSAGIGPNKMLAKIVAGFHKPNQQTLVLPKNIPEMFCTTKLRKIRNLGGKLGAQLEDKFKVEFMSQLLPLSLHELQVVVGSKQGEIVYWLCRGVDHEPVRPRQLPKSIGCSKNFRGKLMLKTPQDVRKWLKNLCEEVVERLEKDREQNDRIASLFTVGCTNESEVNQSRRINVNKHTVDEVCNEAFRGLCEFNRAKIKQTEWNPALINLHIAASKFIPWKGKSMPINSFVRDEENAVPSSSVVPTLTEKSTGANLSSGIHTFFSKAENNEQKCCLHSEPVVIENLEEKTTPGSRGISAYFYNNEVNKKRSMQSLQDVSIQLLEQENSSNGINECKRKHLKTGSKSKNLSESPIPCSVKKYKKSSQTLFSRFLKPISITHPTNISNSSVKDDNCISVPLSSNREKDLSNSLTLKETYPSSFQHSEVHNGDNDHFTSSALTGTHVSPGVTLNDLMSCERCGKRLLAWDLPDHMDFHFARDLQDSLRSNITTETEPQIRSPLRKKVKTNKSLKNYFTTASRP